jgi:hypothetical protein
MPYYIYGHSIIGSSHFTEGLSCQDANKFINLDNGWVVAAVSDGVGSAKNSSIGSNIAVETAVKFVAENLPLSYRENGIKRAIYLGFNAALKQIIRRAEIDKQCLESYDTTLSLVVFNGVNLYYGHSGDGGIFGLTKSGVYTEITKPVKGQDGITVVPLRHGEDTWFIDAYREELSSVLLVTDGVRDALKPYMLGNGANDVYIPVCSIFLNPFLYEKNEHNYIQIIKKYLNNELSLEEILNLLELILNCSIKETSRIKEILKNIKNTGYVFSLINEITDDKTTLAIINSNPLNYPDMQNADYYEEPNWEEKKEILNAGLYPKSPALGSQKHSDIFKNDHLQPVENLAPLNTQNEPPINNHQTQNGKKKGIIHLLIIAYAIIVTLLLLLGLIINPQNEKTTNINDDSIATDNTQGENGYSDVIKEYEQSSKESDTVITTIVDEQSRIDTDESTITIFPDVTIDSSTYTTMSSVIESSLSEDLESIPIEYTETTSNDAIGTTISGTTEGSESDQIESQMSDYTE